MRGLCLHCHRLIEIEARGLCAADYRHPEIRERYAARPIGRPRKPELAPDAVVPKGVMVGTCAECGRRERITGRGLCSACYWDKEIRARHAVLTHEELSRRRRATRTAADIDMKRRHAANVRENNRAGELLLVAIDDARVRKEERLALIRERVQAMKEAKHGAK